MYGMPPAAYGGYPFAAAGYPAYGQQCVALPFAALSPLHRLIRLCRFTCSLGCYKTRRSRWRPGPLGRPGPARRSAGLLPADSRRPGSDAGGRPGPSPGGRGRSRRRSRLGRVLRRSAAPGRPAVERVILPYHLSILNARCVIHAPAPPHPMLPDSSSARPCAAHCTSPNITNPSLNF